MDSLIHQYIKNHPQQVALVLETCSVEDFIDFSHQPNVHIETILPYVSSNYLSKLLDTGEASKIINIVTNLPDMQAATLLKHVSTDKCSYVLESLSGQRKNQIKRLMAFNENQVGYFVQKPKVVLSENNTISQALELISHVKEEELPIYVVSVDYRLLGTLNLLKLIHQRTQLDQTLAHCFTSKVTTIHASSPIESIKSHKAWLQFKSIAITGRDNHFLGVLSKDLLMKKMRAPTKEQSKSPVEEYFFFSEMLWDGLNKFWGALK